MDRYDLYHHIILNEGAYFFRLGIRTITNRCGQVFFKKLRH